MAVHLDQMTFTLGTQDINAHRLSSKRQVSPPSSRLDCIVPDTSYLSTWEFLDCAVCIYAESFPVTPRAARKWPGTASTPALGHMSGTSYTQPVRALLNPLSSTFKMYSYTFALETKENKQKKEKKNKQNKKSQ